MGWRRFLLYWRHRVFRTGDSAHRIAAGLASGAAASFNPFIGTHVAQALFLAWLLRANLLAAFIGTGLGNPATLPFLFWLSYKTGVAIIGLFGMSDVLALPADFTLRTIFHEPLRLLLPMALGGYACGLMCWPVTYALLYYPVRSARKLYGMRHKRGKSMENIVKTR
jgi:uncharacterized protein (DUF2062 family)